MVSRGGIHAAADRLKDRKGAPPPPLPLLPLRHHPARPGTVVWAVGRFIFIHDTTDADAQPHRWEAHTDTIRSLDSMADPCAGASGGTLWVSGGDDKQVIVWEDKGSSWDARFRMGHGKKITATLFDSDGLVVFADRFGDVYRWTPAATGDATLLFSHLAIVTAMAFAGDGRFLVSGDNHEKIRVTCYPEAAEIHSFCLGHTEQITALSPQGPGHLLSAAADGILRLWTLDGESIACCDLGAPVSSFGHSGSSLAACCEEANGALRSVHISDDFSLTATNLEIPGPAQAAYVGAGGVCWVDRRGHLRSQLADGSWSDIFAGEDLPPCIVNLNKNANLWENMEKQDDAEPDEEGKRGKKRGAAPSKDHDMAD